MTRETVQYLPGGKPAAKVVIVLPAYRAEETLAKTVADIPSGFSAHIIVVDDASPDRTAELARQLGLRVHVHPENRGYGGNQKTCYVEALREGADIVVLLHPDYQYDPHAVPLLIAPILAGDADMTFGSRFAGLADPRGGGMPLYRFAGNRVTTVVENLMLGSRFTETHSGLRAYTRRCLLSIPFLRYTDDFAFDSQFLVDAVTSGQRVVEVPIPTRYTQESSSIDVSRSIRYVAESVAYCARQAATRGRRGRRFPGHGAPPARPRWLDGGGAPVQRRCVLCGDPTTELTLPARAAKGPAHDEYACTAPGGSGHDAIARCRRCGMVSSVPSATPDEIVDRYRSVVDPDYLVHEEERRRTFRWFVRMMNGYATPGRRLVELGANIGMFLDEARAGGWDARGIEPSEWAVRTGRERFGVELEQGTIEEYAGPYRAADAVVMLDVLEHVVDPVAALEVVRKVVSEEGILLLATVNLTGLHARLRKGGWPWFMWSHLHYFTPETLTATLRKARFRVVEWRNAPRWFPLAYAAKRAGLPVSDEMVSRGPRVPWGWLGDIALVAARPEARGW